jgi:hypothetical protein
MSEDYMDKLMNDIQQYLKEENRKKRERWPSFLSAKEPAGMKTAVPRPILVGFATLLSACAVGSITVAILLLGLVGISSSDAIGTIWLLAVAGCGIFFTTMLVSAWKRLVLLSQIEENTRQILASKLETNAILDHFMRHIT